MDQLSTGSRPRVTSVLAFVLAAYALYWAIGYVETHLYRISFLLIALIITFLGGASNEGASESDVQPKRTGTARAFDFGLVMF